MNTENLETETVDKLFLELSQITKARTKRELDLEEVIRMLREERRIIIKSAASVIEKIGTTGVGTGDTLRAAQFWLGNWNADGSNNEKTYL